MKETDGETEKYTGRLEITNVPTAHIKKLEELRRKKGISLAAIMKHEIATLLRREGLIA